MPRTTLLAALVALLVGAGGTVLIARALAPSHVAARSAHAVYLPPVGRSAQPAPDFSLPDQAGRLVSLSALRGREVLVTFMDPRCTSLCPIMGQELGSIEASLPARVSPVLLVVSVASDRNAADVASFTSHVAWRPGWHWLLGNQAQLQAVWASWQVAVQPSAADVLHDEVVYIVNPRGQMVAGYNAPLDVHEVATAITQHATR